MTKAEFIIEKIALTLASPLNKALTYTRKAGRAFARHPFIATPIPLSSEPNPFGAVIKDFKTMSAHNMNTEPIKRFVVDPKKSYIKNLVSALEGQTR
jgi:hypothetical protein